MAKKKSYLRSLLDRSAYRKSAVGLDNRLGNRVKSLKDIDNLPAIVGSPSIDGIDIYQLAAELRTLALIPEGESKPDVVAEEKAEEEPKPKRKQPKAKVAVEDDGGK